MAEYNQAFKSKMVQRMVGPAAMSATALAATAGVPQPTLSRWLRDATGTLADMSKQPRPSAPASPRPRRHAWIALYRAEGIERIGSGYLAVRAERAGDALKTFVLPMQSTLDTALPEGWLSAAFHRLSSWREGPDDARVVLDADLVGVDVSSDGSPVAGTSMPFVLAAVLQPAGETGMTLDEIARAIESQGFEMDAERRAELRESLVQLHVAGFLRLR